MKDTKPRPASAQWGLFLRNNDELDLGRLPKEEREQGFAAFGPGFSRDPGSMLNWFRAGAAATLRSRVG